MSVAELVDQIDQLTRDALRTCLGMHDEEDIYKVPEHVLDLFARASGMAKRMGGATFSGADVTLALVLAHELHKQSVAPRPAAPIKPVRGDTMTDADWERLPIEAPLIVHYAGQQRDARYLGKSGRRVNAVIAGDDKPFRQIDTAKVIVTRVAQETDDG